MGVNPAPVFRYLAAIPLPLLFGYYCGFLLAGQLMGVAAENLDSTLLASAGWVWLTVVLSALVTSVALYRDDGLLEASVLLTVMTLAGPLLASSLISIAQTGSLGPALLTIGFAPLQLFVRLVIVAPALGLVVWLARRFRRFLAPDTLEETRIDDAPAT